MMRLIERIAIAFIPPPPPISDSTCDQKRKIRYKSAFAFPHTTAFTLIRKTYRQQRSSRLLVLCFCRWSPPELPRCVDEFHPKMAWLSKRCADNYYAHSERGPQIPKRLKRAIRQRDAQGGCERNCNVKIDWTTNRLITFLYS